MSIIDTMEKTEQRMWRSAGKKAGDKARKAKRSLSPKNYRWGILGMVLYGLGTMLAFVLKRVDADEWLLRWGRATFISPMFDDYQGNIWHEG